MKALPSVKAMALIKAVASLTLLLWSMNSLARDDIREYSIAEALASEQAQNILGTDVQFFFGDEPHPDVITYFLEFRSNRKTNGTNKSDKEACEWVFLSTMKSLKQRAQSLGANAVINIKSNYRNNLTTSNTHFMCGSGELVSGVALVGDVVTIQK